MIFWTLTEPGAGLVNDFYVTREEAEAALEEAKAAAWHPEDVAVLEPIFVAPVALDDVTPSAN